jgi:hypothetical protein
MKIPDISNSIHQNRVHYIGHGQLESSSENLSALHVISHELAHVAEFKSEARRLGMDISDVKVHIHYELRDGKLVAVAGETEAVYLPKKDKDSKVDVQLDISAFLLTDIPRKDKLEKELVIIETEIKNLEKELLFKANDTNSNLELKYLQKLETLSQNKDKLEKEINSIQSFIDPKESNTISLEKDSIHLDKIFGKEARGTNLDKLA